MAQAGLDPLLDALSAPALATRSAVDGEMWCVERSLRRAYFEQKNGTLERLARIEGRRDCAVVKVVEFAAYGHALG